MSTLCVLPLDSSCCNCLQTMSVDSFVAVFNICGSRVSVTEGLQVAFESATTTKETPYKFLKLCTLCAEILQRLLHAHTEFAHLTAAGSYVEVLRQKLSTVQAQFENEELKPDLNVLGGVETTPLIETENFLLQPATECIMQTMLARKKRTGRSVIREKNVKKGASDRAHRTRKAATLEGTLKTHTLNSCDSDKDPLALTEDESETNQDKLRRSKRIVKSHNIVTHDSDSESESKVMTSDEDAVSDFNADRTSDEDAVSDFNADRSSDEKSTTKKRSRANRNRNVQIRTMFTRKPCSNEDKDLLTTITYKCDECAEVSFDSYKAWVLHQESVHGLDLGYGDLSGKEILIPIKSHFRPCPMCGKKYKSNAAVIYHMRSNHLDFSPYTCEICHKNLRTKYTYNTHVKDMHAMQGPQYLCVLCAKSFKTKSNLLTHEKTHMGLVTNNIECTICHSKYSKISRLRDHMASAHSDVTPFVCEKCGKAFKVHGHLKTHMRKQHYKKFIIDAICKFCGKGYAFKGKLKDHLMSVHKLSKEDARISVGSKPTSIFRVLPNGERVFIEKPTKPKTCSFCGRTYVRREQLFTHLMSVHAQTHEQAKEITGLDSKRNLLPGTDARSRKRKYNVNS